VRVFGMLACTALIPVLVLSGCSQGATGTPVRAGSSAVPATAAETAERAPGTEPNVLTGRVTTEQGDPITGAQIRIVGYTGGAGLGQEIETVETGPDGTYRYAVPRGLYEVLGQATLDFDRQAYTFDLHPADGHCEQRMSDDGIVQDFVLRLTGLIACRNADLPDDYTSYHGAAIQLFDGTTGSPREDAVVEYTLEPVGPLADGSPGETLTMNRTVAALRTSAGPIDRTWILYDIPLAVYRVSATLVEPGGTRVPLFVSSDTESSIVPDVEVRFGARTFLGGYTVPQVRVHDEPEVG